MAALSRLSTGFGRTRFFSRAARNVVPWLHPPRWLFGMNLNSFVDQVGLHRPAHTVPAHSMPCVRSAPLLVRMSHAPALSLALVAMPLVLLAVLPAPSNTEALVPHTI